MNLTNIMQKLALKKSAAAAALFWAAANISHAAPQPVDEALPMVGTGGHGGQIIF